MRKSQTPIRITTVIFVCIIVSFVYSLLLYSKIVDNIFEERYIINKHRLENIINVAKQSNINKTIPYEATLAHLKYMTEYIDEAFYTYGIMYDADLNRITKIRTDRYYQINEPLRDLSFYKVIKSSVAGDFKFINTTDKDTKLINLQYAWFKLTTDDGENRDFLIVIGLAKQSIETSLFELFMFSLLGILATSFIINSIILQLIIKDITIKQYDDLPVDK